MRRNQRATVALVVELERRGLSPIVLKGPSTQALLYPGEARTSTDIDLLVAPRQRRAAQRALADLGYERFFTTSYATSWAAPDQEPVDLHTTLPRCHIRPARVGTILGCHRTTISVEGRDLPVLDAPAVAMHLTLHLTQSASDRTLEDLRRAVHQLTVDQWKDAAGLARQLGTRSSMAWALDQVPGGSELRGRLGLSSVERSDLPARKVSEGGLATLLTSPVHWHERAFDLWRVARKKTGRTSLDGWARHHGRPAPTSGWQFAETLAARAVSFARSPLPGPGEPNDDQGPREVPHGR